MQQQAALRQGSFTRTNGAPVTHDVWPRFHIEAVQDMLASERSGRPIFKDEERVEINMPGNPYSKPVMVVTDEHRERWPEEYAAFKRGEDVAISGTPLEMWSILKPSMVRELKALDIMTVEQVAALNDHAIQRIPMLGRRLKELAQVYLDEAAGMAFATAAQAERDHDKAEIASLRLQVENMNSQMAQLFAQFQTKMNAPEPQLIAVPALSDPREVAKYLNPRETAAPAQSSLELLADLPVRRRKQAAAPPESPDAA